MQDETVAELQESPVYSDEKEEEITLIPMGCARLRMSCLPIVDNGPESRKWVTPPPHVPFEDRPKNRFDELYPIERVPKDKGDL
jgi:hypothetical protein